MSVTGIKKFVSVIYYGKISECDNIQGPIQNPAWMDIDTIHTLVKNGKDVYEHNIVNTDERILLTVENYNDVNIFPGNALVQDTSIPDGAYVLSFDDAPLEDFVMTTGNIYVDIEK